MRIVHDEMDHRIFVANRSLAEDVTSAIGVSQTWRFHAYRAFPRIAHAATPTEGNCSSCISKKNSSRIVGYIRTNAKIMKRSSSPNQFLIMIRVYSRAATVMVARVRKKPLKT